MKPNKLNYSPTKRLLTVLMLITFIFIFVTAKLFVVQIIQGNKLQLKAYEQWTRDLPLTAQRGEIVDVNGNVLATTLSMYTVYVRPNAVKDNKKVATALSDKLGVDYNLLYKKLVKKGVSEITVAKKVPKYVMQDLVQLGLDGVYFSANIKRYYPYNDLLSQVLGFTNVDSDGQSGIEAYYNKYLKGNNGRVLTETDLIGRQINSGNMYIPAVPGQEIKLTVDYNIQLFADKIVKEAMIKHEAKSSTCIVMNPQNGQILALAQAPSFDLNNVPRDNIAELFEQSKINAIANVFEPGSTFKVVTSSIGLEEQLFAKDHKFYCNGSRIVDGKKIKCWKSIGHGSQTFSDGVKNSCNCVFMDIALKAGVSTYYKYLREFGLLEKTGVDLVGEASGLCIAEKNVKPVDLARIGFGQAIAVTPIELINAVATAINGGRRYTPYIMDSIYDDVLDCYVIKNEPNFVKNVISKNTSYELRQMLERVVTEGSGKGCYIPGYRIGGKTGTAQKYENGTIARGKYVSSFMGFAPLNNPQYVVLFIVDEPSKGLYYGSQVCAPPVGTLFQNIFDYKSIAPVFTEKDKEIIGEEFEMPNLVGMTVKEAKYELYKMGLYYEVDGEGNKVVDQYPVVGSKIDKRFSVMLTLK